MVLSVLAFAAGLAWLACAVLVYIHAFQRSVGTGVIVLCVPFYLFFYAFSQFEHRRKNVIVAALFGSSGLAVVMLAAAQAGLSTRVGGFP